MLWAESRRLMAAALVIGGDGQIGAALRSRLAVAGEHVVATSRRPAATGDDRLLLDLSLDLSSWRPPDGIDLAYLCAAITSVAACEADPAGTRRVNLDGLWTVSQLLLEAGAFVVLPSTNLVFDGTSPHRPASDPVSPLTEYGRQKADFEQLLLGAGGQTAVVRLTKVLSPQSRLLREWATKLRAGEAIHPFSDMVMAPVTLALATETLLKVGIMRASGIAQVSAEEDVTYEEAARRLAVCLGARGELIQPIRAAEVGIAPEAVPQHTTLDASRLQDLGLKTPQAWETLDTIYAQLAAEI
jgi:dTDP-4-dehydrorhamnose reductase